MTKTNFTNHSQHQSALPLQKRWRLNWRSGMVETGLQVRKISHLTKAAQQTSLLRSWGLVLARPTKPLRLAVANACVWQSPKLSHCPRWLTILAITNQIVQTTQRVQNWLFCLQQPDNHRL
jgi:hypothetical protein